MIGVIGAFFGLLVVASAGVVVPSVHSPLAYSAPLGYSAPWAYSAPLTYGAPWTYGAPLAYSAPVAYSAVQSGYVAANRGAVHVAPLPEGPFAASHHINTAPAPGTV